MQNSILSFPKYVLAYFQFLFSIEMFGLFKDFMHPPEVSAQKDSDGVVIVGTDYAKPQRSMAKKLRRFVASTTRYLWWLFSFKNSSKHFLIKVSFYCLDHVIQFENMLDLFSRMEIRRLVKPYQMTPVINYARPKSDIKTTTSRHAHTCRTYS